MLLKKLLSRLSLILFILIIMAHPSFSKDVVLKDINVEDFVERMRVNLLFTSPVKYEIEMLDTPPRLMVILTGVKVKSSLSETKPVRKGGLNRIRLSYLPKKIYLKYIILELVQKVEYAVIPRDSKIIVDLYKVSDIKEEAEPSPVRLISTLTGIVELDDCLKVAFSNNLLLQISREEIALAKLKVKESERNLFPSLSLKWDEVSGESVRETGTPDFRERTYGMEMGHPLYQGGRLSATLRQAKLGVKFGGENYRKVKSELTFEVKNAFYDRVRQKLKQEQLEKLEKKCKRLLGLVKKKYRSKLTTRLEFLNANYLYKQIQYQLDSTKRDLSLSQLTLEQLMNIEPMPIDLDTKLIIEPPKIKLEHCLALALNNRSELKIAELEAESQKLERDIAKAENRFKVDLSGFYGKSGGAYKTETLELSEDWFFGIKVTKALGGNTFTGSTYSDETSPKLGQTTRTKSTSGSAKFSLLDNLARFSYEKETKVKYKKAQEEIDKTKDMVIRNVHEAYYNYQKSLEQLNTLKEEIKFRKENVKIIKSKHGLNLAEISEVIQAEQALADAYISNIEAEIFYLQALASLNKAMGVDEF